MQADYTIHSGWGNHIEWINSDFSNIDFNTDLIEVYGHMPNKPKVGDTLMGEFQRSFIKFEFVEVSYPGNPPDMFFGKVKTIDQEMK